MPNPTPLKTWRKAYSTNQVPGNFTLAGFLQGGIDAVVRLHLGDAVLKEAKDIVHYLLAQK